MPGKHDRHDGHLHGHQPKHEGPPPGPKERELAVSLTVAVLAAADVKGSLEDVEALALRTYGRMLDAITKAPTAPAPLPPTVTIGT